MCTHRSQVQCSWESSQAGEHARTLKTSRAQDTTLKTEVILFYFMTREFKQAKNSCVAGQNFAPTTKLFRKTGQVTREKLSLQHVPAVFLPVCPTTFDIL